MHTPNKGTVAFNQPVLRQRPTVEWASTARTLHMAMRQPARLDDVPRVPYASAMGRVLRRSAVVAAACLLALCVGGSRSACATTGMGMDIDLAGQRPSDLGPTAGGRYLQLCNAVEPCVSSSETVGTKRYVAPWTFNDDGRAPVARKQAMAELVAALEEQPEITVVSRSSDYMYSLSLSLALSLTCAKMR
jgi:uncharacterized protein (DUF1499 family)